VAESRRQWLIVALLVVSVAINFIDRGNLSVAVPLLKVEMNLSPLQLGRLLASFFWSYAVFQLLAGWLVDRGNVNQILAAGMMLASLATAGSALVRGFGALLALRFLVGIGESAAYPSYSKILTQRLTESQRGVANAWIDAGSKFGPAIGTFLGGMLVPRFGWRAFFIMLGLTGLIWLPFWLVLGRGNSPATVREQDLRRPTIREILRHRAIWATFTGHFCGNYFYYFLLTWLPYYLVSERHFSMQTMGAIGAMAPLFASATTMGAAWLSRRALARGVSTTRVRKTCTVFGLGFATVIVAVPALSGAWLPIGILLFASASYGVFSSSHWAITQTIAGPLAVGRWSGMQNFVANLAGVAAPMITGAIIDRTGRFFWAFAVAGGVTLVGSAAYWFGLGRVEPAEWECAPTFPIIK